MISTHIYRCAIQLHAVNITILTPSLNALRKMQTLCEEDTQEHTISFSASWTQYALDMLCSLIILVSHYVVSSCPWLNRWLTLVISEA